MGHFKRKFQVEGDIPCQPLKWLFFYVVSEYRQHVLLFRHKPRVWETDWQMNGRTDGQKYDPQDRASIDASRFQNQVSRVLQTQCRCSVQSGPKMRNILLAFFKLLDDVTYYTFDVECRWVFNDSFKCTLYSKYTALMAQSVTKNFSM